MNRNDLRIQVLDLNGKMVFEANTEHKEKNQFDSMALIYTHFPADVKSTFHKLLSNYFKPGGIVIFEAFSKNLLALNNEKEGGPKDINM